ncbi:hypothetical protein Dvina_34595 [Dactylosporangium vinaceum]|uniref:Uncharacterized protein n=1 Tax=Dactylosporangium vinaceum TaxID=53362 RepID=A0ABV5MMX2_9ACTN|nr:hypothetical protein [Dactylosporangium vinaceum]UAB93365.1 hypothetical protein Dvina_34595 [Dactylosporangium vinaceum]
MRAAVRRRVLHPLTALLLELGVVRLVAAPLAGLSLLATLFGATRQTPLATTIGLAVALVFVLAAAALLTGLLWQERRRGRGSDSVIRRLTQTLRDQQTPSAYTWERWIEEATVDRGGDMTLRQWRTLRSVTDPVRVVWAAFEQTPHGNLTAAQKRGITVTANSFTTDPDGGRTIGPSFDLTRVWFDEADALVVYLCFADPVPPGETLGIVFTWFWPGCYRHLLAGGRDDVFFLRRRGSVGELDVTYTFLPATGVADRLLVRPLPGSPLPSRSGTDEATFTVTYRGPLPERVGFTLEAPDLPHGRDGAAVRSRMRAGRAPADRVPGGQRTRPRAR